MFNRMERIVLPLLSEEQVKEHYRVKQIVMMINALLLLAAVIGGGWVLINQQISFVARDRLVADLQSNVMPMQRERIAVLESVAAMSYASQLVVREAQPVMSIMYLVVLVELSLEGCRLRANETTVYNTTGIRERPHVLLPSKKRRAQSQSRSSRSSLPRSPLRLHTHRASLVLNAETPHPNGGEAFWQGYGRGAGYETDSGA